MTKTVKKKKTATKAPAPIHQILPDFRLEPSLRKRIGEVRGSLVQSAERSELPKGFKVEADISRPVMHITHEATGKTAEVSLFAYGEVRQTLNALFARQIGGASQKFNVKFL